MVSGPIGAPSFAPTPTERTCGSPSRPTTNTAPGTSPHATKAVTAS